MDGGGQGEHDVALVPQEVGAEAVHHGDEGHEADREDGQEEGQGQQAAHQVQKPGVRLQQEAHGEAGGEGRQQQDAEQGQQDAARGTELVLHQFSQHLNTSRKS